jgi:hypothetical protein
MSAWFGTSRPKGFNECPDTEELRRLPILIKPRLSPGCTIRRLKASAIAGSELGAGSRTLIPVGGTFGTELRYDDSDRS